MSVTFDTYRWEFTLIERLLGTVPKHRDVYERFIAKHDPDVGDDELIEDLEDAGWTSFYRDEDGRPVLFDYQLKGFLKEVGNILKDQLGIKNLRSHIENTVYVRPRRLVLGEEVDGDFSRPLRAMTMQGPRVSVRRSDFMEAGRSYTVWLDVLKGSKVTKEVLEAIIDFGKVRGIGQWRNGSYGRFDGKLIQE
jgi:hypothetical protein